MSPDSLTKLRQFFLRNSRVRGGAYAADGRARIRVKPQNGTGRLEAEVAGSDVYRVVLQDGDDTLDVLCECPYFDREGELCKHIWATLLEAVRTRAYGDRLFRSLSPADDAFHDGGDPHDRKSSASSMPPAVLDSRLQLLRAARPVPLWKQSLQSATRPLRHT